MIVTPTRLAKSISASRGPALRLVEWLCSRDMFEREHSLDRWEKTLLKTAMAKLAEAGQTWDDTTDDLDD